MAEMEKLASVCRVVRVERGDMIWFSGADVDFFGICSDVFVKMVRSTCNGTDVTLELMGPGQSFGMSGAIAGTGCPLSAYAVTDGWYVRVPKQAFLELFNTNSLLKDRMLRRTIFRLHAAVDLTARMSSGRVDERIAAILFILAESYGHTNRDGVRLDVPLTRQEISEMAGTTVESTIRVMSRWQKEGLVTTDHHYVTIKNTNALSRVMSGA
jgi:CRP/FNR family transcriptional regulator